MPVGPSLVALAAAGLAPSKASGGAELLLGFAAPRRTGLCTQPKQAVGTGAVKLVSLVCLPCQDFDLVPVGCQRARAAARKGCAPADH